MLSDALAVGGASPSHNTSTSLSVGISRPATLDSLGYIHHHLGHHPRALDYYQQALRLFSDLGDRYKEAGTLTSLGETHHARGDADAARECWQQALAILAELGHPDADTVRARLGEPHRLATATEPRPAG